MAIKSMTGYGKGIYEKDGVKLTLELKSVNHRFLDLTIKLPKYFTFAEDVIRKQLKDNFNRGHIDAYVNYEDNRLDKCLIEIDYAMVSKYVEASKKIAGDFFCQDTLGTNEILNLPDVVKNTANEESEDELRLFINEALTLSMAQLDTMRSTEGALIEKDLLQKIQNIKDIVEKIAALAPVMVTEHRQKLKDRITEILGDVVVDETRLLNEVAFYADKVCIDEEITRLTSHTTHFMEIINNGGIVGKQLDFIVQEMNRETNTIGSKCNNFDVANLVVALKSEIEKVREQIQNIE